MTAFKDTKLNVEMKCTVASTRKCCRVSFGLRSPATSVFLTFCRYFRTEEDPRGWDTKCCRLCRHYTAADHGLTAMYLMILKIEVK